MRDGIILFFKRAHCKSWLEKEVLNIVSTTAGHPGPFDTQNISLSGVWGPSIRYNILWWYRCPPKMPPLQIPEFSLKADLKNPKDFTT